MRKQNKAIILIVIISIVYYFLMYYLSYYSIKLALYILPQENYNLLVLTQPICYLFLISLTLIGYKKLKFKVLEYEDIINRKGLIVIIALVLLLRTFNDFIINFEYIFFEKTFELVERTAEFNYIFWNDLLTSVIIGPILEELVFRGLIFRILLRSRINLIVSLTITSLLFTIGHINPLNINYSLLIIAFWLGIVLSLVYLRYKLSGAVSFHIFYNLIVFILGVYSSKYLGLMEITQFNWFYWGCIILSLLGVLFIFKKYLMPIKVNGTD